MATATRQSVSDDRQVLTPVLADKYALGLRHVVVCALFGGLFLFLNHMPLWHTDLWGHVAYGKWILAHRTLPSEDPFMPLAEGMRAVDYAWLSQVILGEVEAWGGAEWLSNLFAGVVLLSYLILTRVFYLRTGRLGLSLLGMLMALAIGWSRLSTLRPEIFGILCFSLLLWLVVGETARQRDGEAAKRGPTVLLWIGVPLLFAFWANLHSSVLCGLAVMACCCVGRCLDVAWTTKSVGATLRDRSLRRWLLLGELATAASLLNPYGMVLLIWCVQFGGNANLRDVVEWFPLVLQSPTGAVFGLSCVLLGVALRFSRRRFSPADVLLWAVFALAAASSIRMIGWYAAVVVLVLAPHLTDMVDRLVAAGRSTRRREKRLGQGVFAHRSFRYSLVCLLLVWMSFAFSGWSRPLLGRNPRPREAICSSSTPMGVSKFLRENPPEGQIFNPQWWGDWLVWDGPAGLRPFVTTNVHLVPRLVWNDYVRIANARPGWQGALDRYRVTTMVIDKKGQPLLAPVMRREPGWSVRYEDDQGMVLTRSSRTPDVDAPASESAGDQAENSG